MSDASKSAMPPASSRAAWGIVIAIFVAGMVVAGFLLDAGQVWVTSKTVTWEEIEHTNHIDAWMPHHEARQKVDDGSWEQASTLSVVDERHVDTGSNSNTEGTGSNTEGTGSDADEDVVHEVHLRGLIVTDQWVELGSDELAAAQAAGGTLGSRSSWVERKAVDLVVLHSAETTSDDAASIAAASEAVRKDAESQADHFGLESVKIDLAVAPVPGAQGQVEVVAAASGYPNGSSLSVSRTIGVWLAAILTLCIMSFLAGDNPFYKTAESIVVGASAAYWMVLSFWTGIVDKLLVNLIPDITRAWAVPGLPESAEFKWIYLIPLVLSCMLIWRLSPKGGWIARWPLAFVIGATAGFRLLSHLESDFLLQIKLTITSLWVIGAGEFDLWNSVGAIVVLLSVLCCLVYFFFSMEHKGAVGKTAKAGIYVLMVTFGAAFGLTVMGRITLLTERFDFLFKDWLHLIQ